MLNFGQYWLPIKVDYGCPLFRKAELECCGTPLVGIVYAVPIRDAYNKYFKKDIKKMKNISWQVLFISYNVNVKSKGANVMKETFTIKREKDYDHNRYEYHVYSSRTGFVITCQTKQQALRLINAFESHQ